jgi:hypothetical protein
MDSKADNTQKSSILARFFGWLFTWRTVRRALVSLACFATLVGLFYTEEDWRGKRAWEQCRRELQSKGVLLDWSAFIPPPVPDDQNFFKAPGIHEADWVGRGPTRLSKRFADAISLKDRDTNSTVVAEVTIVPPNSNADLRISDVDAPVKARKLIEDVVGPTTSSPLGYTFGVRSLKQNQLARIILSASQAPTTNGLTALFPRSIVPGALGPGESCLQIESDESNSFRVLLSPPPEPASDYLSRTESLAPEFDAFRTALERPYARMDGDYKQPGWVPIPDFVLMRILAQTLASRTQCHLLLNQPEEALRDLTLLHGLYHVLEARPTGQPMTLVASMINAAIVGLYADTIGDGFRLHAWREPQLVALEQQLAEINLLPILASSFLEERPSFAETFEKTSPFELFKAEKSIQGEKATWWGMMENPLYRFWTLAPHGWLYQNMVFSFKLQPLAQIGDLTNDLVLPDKARRCYEETAAISKWAPYSFLSTLFIPNGSRAWKVTASQQTKANEALLACALERYRLAHGNYPETLDTLAPQFIEKIPHDLIGGQPLHYRRGENGTFLLYSIGWNERDDGGQEIFDKNGNPTLDDGDWVWQPAPKN